MFVHAWPLWANLGILIVLLMTKWLGIKYVEKTAAYRQLIVGKGWMATASLTAGVNALVMFVLLFLWVGTGWGLVLALVDGAIHWLLGYWQKKHQLPTLSAGNVSTGMLWWSEVKSWVSAIHVGTYVTIAGWVMSYGLGHSSSIGTVFSLIKTFLVHKP